MGDVSKRMRRNIMKNIENKSISRTKAVCLKPPGERWAAFLGHLSKLETFFSSLSAATGSPGKKKTGKYKNSYLHPRFVEECLRKISYLMDMEKVYRDETLSLQSLAEKCSISPHCLSQIINEHLKKSFPDLINGYRVEEAKTLLGDRGRVNRKVLAIAFEVGFNTKSGFNKVFKKYTNMTPTQYRKNAGGDLYKSTPFKSRVKP
jgi:AraC-like DNA-binding protein